MSLSAAMSSFGYSRTSHFQNAGLMSSLLQFMQPVSPGFNENADLILLIDTPGICKALYGVMKYTAILWDCNLLIYARVLQDL